jgi:hypothetical protein
MPLDEKSKRRPDFAGGTAVVLADGQEWTLAKPLVRFAFDSGEDGFTTTLSVNGVDDFASLMRDVDAAYEKVYGDRDAAGDEKARVDFGPVIRAELAVGAALLRRNYDLTPEEMSSVLQFSYDDSDEVGEGARSAVMDIAKGIGPKPPGGMPESQ